MQSSPSNGVSDTNLDDRIRFALNELDFHERNHERASNFPQPSTHINSELAESDDDSTDSEDEAYPNAMGYMPLPQEPDVDCSADNGEEGVRPHLPIQQQAVGETFCHGEGPGSSTRSPMSQATLEEGLGAECEPRPKDIAEGESTQSKGASRNPAPSLKDGKSFTTQYYFWFNHSFIFFVDEVESIKKAMSGFSLPTSAVPEWAKHVPEEVWKSELMDGLHRKLKPEKRS